MAAYSAVASLMNNIEQIMIHPHLSTSLDRYQVQSLLKTAALLLDFMEGYAYGGVMSKEVEDLERQIALTAHAAEDVIESHVVDQIHAGTSRASLRCLIDLEQIIEDMDGVSKKVNEFKEKQGFSEEQPTNSTRPLMETSTTMVGFEEELIRILDELTNQQSSRNIVSIVGMGGTGKTTLARNVYQNLLIKQHFDLRAWATVSQQYNVDGILSQLLSSLGIVGQSGEQLYKTLIGRRYLIILDDIWSVEAWDEVMRFFPDNGNRSRVCLTTRLSNVARDCLCNSCFAMKPLDEDQSWELLCRKAFQKENCPYPKLERVGREIASLCRGLPLSTVVVGGLLLKSPRSLRFWENVVYNIRSNPNSKEKDEILDILSLSYNHLPSHLKPCFLYMGVFEEDSEVRVSRIIKLWIAEGLLRAKNTRMLEDDGERYLKELIDRNLISVRKLHKNGKIGSCNVHDMLRDLCLKVGERQEFFHVSDAEIRGTERRIICPWWKRLLPGGPSLGRSILAWNAYPEEAAANRKLLRVWETYRSVHLPEKLCGNVNLRYIAFVSLFSGQPEWGLPSSVSLLWNLQTLVIRSDSSTVVAPIEIWKMRQLRHVECSRIYVPSDGFLMMDNLQTLTTAVNLRLSKQVCEMIPNIKKLHLLYQRNLHGYDDSLIEFLRNLGRLHKLESLKLSIKGNRKLITESELIKKLPFPASLNKLSLSGCQLGWEDLRTIASLPQLEVLVLGIDSVMVGNKWSTVDDDEQFLRLKYLKIDWCNLHCWEADSSNFPVLTKLVLSGLRQLEEIPWGIGEILTLELIRVEYCSEYAAISALKIKEDQVEMGNDGPQIQVRIFDKDFESFKEKVETEGLTIDCIQSEIR